MDKKKKKKVNNKYKNDNKRMLIVFVMIVCIIIAMCTYWIYAYHYKYGNSNDRVISYKISDYVTTDGNLVYLSNIDKDISDNFVISQREILSKNIIGMDVNKSLNKDILSIKISYILPGGLSNYEEVITLNVNIRENRLVSNEELLDASGGTYKDIATGIFDEYIKLPSDSSNLVVDAITGEKMSNLEFNNNREKYIIRIREKLPDIIKLYIDDGNIYYLVRKYEINKVCYNTNTDINMGYINNKVGKI